MAIQVIHSLPELLSSDDVLVLKYLQYAKSSTPAQQRGLQQRQQLEAYENSA